MQQSVAERGGEGGGLGIGWISHRKVVSESEV